MTKEEVKALIAEKIKTNGEGEITAEVLANVLNEVVDGEDDLGVLKVGYNDMFDCHDILGHKIAMVLVLDEGGQPWARIIPCSQDGVRWLYEYQDGWREITENVGDMDGHTYDGLLVWADDHSRPVVGESTRVITCDLPVELFQMDAFRYYNSVSDQVRTFLYKEIFGHDYVATSEAIYNDLSNLKENVVIRFSNLTVEGKKYAMSPFALIATVSPNDGGKDEASLFAYLRTPSDNYIFDIAAV